MKIAHLLPYTARFPLKKHNGRYEWALTLAKKQARDGHDVAIFSSPDSQGEPLNWRSISEDTGSKSTNNIQLISTAFIDDSFDVFHSHFDWLAPTLAHLTPKPIITTQHWFPNEKIANGLSQNQRPNIKAVPVTMLMKQTNQHLAIPSSDVIYHGIDLDLFTFNPTPSSRYLFVGRICLAKGVKEAVELARQTGIELDIVGKVNPVDEASWNEILPLVDGNTIRYLGPKTHDEVVRLMQQAKAFIFPSRQEEAFGLVTIEAQACGTPVIISTIGASRELVIDGQTGFIADSEATYKQAIHAIDSIDRSRCRLNAERFDFNNMARKYEELYKQLVSIAH